MKPKKAASEDPYLLAMQFEKIGQDFYAELAQVSDDANARKLFARLAKEEARHYEIFLRFRDAAADKPASAIDRDAALDLMKAHVLPSPKAVRRVALGGHLSKALDLALELERNSILFYRRLALVHPARENDLAKIVQEEQRHAQLIGGLIKRLSGSDRPAEA